MFNSNMPTSITPSLPQKALSTSVHNFDCVTSNPYIELQILLKCKRARLFIVAHLRFMFIRPLKSTESVFSKKKLLCNELDQDRKRILMDIVNDC